MKYLVLGIDGKKHIIDCAGFEPSETILWRGPELEGKIAETLVVADGKLTVDAAKLAVHEAEVAAAKALGDSQRAERTARLARIRAANPGAANSVAELRAIVKDLVDEVNDR
jgi:hypothetical protein